jgi:transposase-like protein
MIGARATRAGEKRKKRYSSEFKESALEKLNSGDYSLRSLAAELGVSVVTLLNWRRQGVQPPTARVRAFTAADQDEVARLRAEITELKAECDRLRKGIAILVGLKTD